MIARGLHHRLEGRGEHILDEHLTAHRPRGDFGLAAVAEQQQRPLPPTTICGFSAA